ncbi:MAG: hypothetical protein CVU36_12300 [Betaproteobacteria bacterium HGW-Betaproteobacteria-9]|jgi:hypothetical protein|nr:MAG: hypothetical protein CVU36_12300 [Betaproteobacteria bacterium HGW-Betaproteobacteria-9]
MDPLSKEAIEERLALLVSGRFAELRALTLLQDEQQDRQLHKRLAEADLREVNLLDSFERWVAVNLYAACQTVLPALGLSSRADVPRLMRLLRMVSGGNDPRANYISKALQVRFTSQPSLPVELAACFDSDGPITDMACRVWATSFVMAHPVAATQFVVDRLEPQASDQRAVRALVVTIPWLAAEVRTQLTSHRQAMLTWLKGLLETNADDAWYCLVELGQFDSDAYALVADGLERGVSPAAQHVARTLFRMDGTAYAVNEVPLAGVLQRLVTLACADASVCDNVDLALSSCLKRQSQRPIAIDCVRALEGGPDDVLKRFDSTFYALCEDAALFKEVLTGWLLSPMASFEVISATLNLVATNRAPAGLDEALFARASPLVRTKAVRRLLGLLSDGRALCQFAADIARMETLGAAGLELASQMFNLLKDEFPHATEDFLKPLATSALRRERGAQVFRGVYAIVMTWKRHLERLPNRPELHVGDADAMALRTARMKHQREIHRGAEAMSVFASVMTKVHIAQGHRFTSHMQDGPSPISDMGHFSHAVELPSSELSDPMRGLLHRMQMRGTSR